MGNTATGALSELQILNYIFEKNSLSIINENGITADYFTTYKPCFTFLLDYYNKYNQLPSRETFQVKFDKNWSWLTVTDSAEYLIAQLREAKLYRDVIVDYGKMTELIREEKTDKAIALMSAISQKYLQSSPSSCVDLVTERQQRYESYLERVNNPSSAFVSTGLAELDDVLGGWDMLNETALICARTGVGKCLQKGTRVLMADGTYKNVEDVKVGDVVQSYNRVNTVQALHHGTSKGYSIIPRVGQSFTVSENHILTLMHRTKDGKYELVDMTVEDVIALPWNEAVNYFLIRCEIDYKSKKTPINPYTVGAYIGGIYCEAEERLHDDDTLNKVLEMCRSQGIPVDYRVNSVKNRLLLLAGIIDVAGKFEQFPKNCITIYHRNKETLKQITTVANSVGFKCFDIQSSSQLYKMSFESCQRSMSEIPCQLVRIAPYAEVLSEYNLTRFGISPIESIEYYGFMCDGDHRYLLEDCTLTHNTWWLAYFAMSAAKAGLRVGYYSGEMEADLIGYRIDTMLGNISNGALTHGNAVVKDSYKTYMDSLTDVISGHIYCITPDDPMFNGSVTVGKLKAFVEKYDLQMLCIDQFSLLDDQKGAKTPREQAVNISKDLRTLQRLKKIPILAAVQLNREDTSVDGVSTKNISESDRIGQDATTILAVERKADDLITLSIVKARNAKSGAKLSYMWNINQGTIQFIPTDGDARNGKETADVLEHFSNDKSDNVF